MRDGAHANECHLWYLCDPFVARWRNSNLDRRIHHALADLVWISDKLGFNLKKYEFAFFGLVLVVMMLFRPQGFIPAARTKQVRQAEKEMEATIAVAVES